MEAKSELLEDLCRLFPGEEPRTQIAHILSRYTVGEGVQSGYDELKRLIASFLAAKRIEGLSGKTLDNYRYSLELFRMQANQPAAGITVGDIWGYVAYLSDGRHLKDSSIRTHLNTLRSFFSWLSEAGIVRENPIFKVRRHKIEAPGSRHALSAEETEQLRNACQAYKEKALVEFLVSSGCRLGEVVGIELAQINWQERSVTVHGKGNKDRNVYFSVRAKLMLEEYIEQRKGGLMLFSADRQPYCAMGPRAIQRALQKIGERAGLPRRIHPHLMRHTFATSALNGGMDITVIQRLLGHTDLKTTQIYAELSQNAVRYQYERLIA